MNIHSTGLFNTCNFINRLVREQIPLPPGPRQPDKLVLLGTDNKKTHTLLTTHSLMM